MCKSAGKIPKRISESEALKILTFSNTFHTDYTSYTLSKGCESLFAYTQCNTNMRYYVVKPWVKMVMRLFRCFKTV